MTKEIGIIGLGKMGGGIARRLLERGWTVCGYDPARPAARELAKEGLRPADSPAAVARQLRQPRVVWLMVPAGKAVDEALFGSSGIAAELSKGDIVADGGNSFYKDSIERARKMEAIGVAFVDAGFSGGPRGAREGGSLMIGGDEASFKALEPLFADLAAKNGCRFFPGAGAGHFVKMVHNGIEYGMMQSLAEGFAILKKSEYKLNLARVAGVYNHGSVIESRLVGWLQKAFEEWGEDLESISGSVGHSGEGQWTAETARELGVPAAIIEESFEFRVRSEKNPNYLGKLVNALRGQFGGHPVLRKTKP